MREVREAARERGGASEVVRVMRSVIAGVKREGEVKGRRGGEGERGGNV